MAKTISFVATNAQFNRAIAAITASQDYILAHQRNPSLTVQDFATGLMWDAVAALVKQTERRLATQAAVATVPVPEDLPVTVTVT